MVINLTLNDDTQKKIIKELETTSELLNKVGSKLSKEKKECKIYVMPDLGIAQNGTRMIGGFYTGACYTWESDIPFVPIDTTVNVCGTAVYKLKQNISTEEFKKRLENVMNDRQSYINYVERCLPKHIRNVIDYKDENKFYWNFCEGNHFVILAEQKENNPKLPKGQYMIVHASAIELKKNNSEYGLYPEKGNWYYDEIKTEYSDDGKRYLRYIQGETAERFFKIADVLKTINKQRNRYFSECVLGDLMEDEILNISHYGMPTQNSVCIGCQWDMEKYTLLTAPGNDVFLVNPNVKSSNSVKSENSILTLTPHGCGVKLNNESDTIEYLENGIKIGDKEFHKGEKINIGNDVIVRTSDMNNKELQKHINKILEKCPGEVIGKLNQIYAKTKHGSFIYKEIEEEEK